MKTITASEARANLYKLIDETAVTSEPVQITGKRTDAVLISINDFIRRARGRLSQRVCR
jgi:antitoxin YefM